MGSQGGCGDLGALGDLDLRAFDLLRGSVLPGVHSGGIFVIMRGEFGVCRDESGEEGQAEQEEQEEDALAFIHVTHLSLLR